jgi:hypothetical protein
MSVPEMRAIFKKKSPSAAGDFRKSDNNHLLFRPAGQRAFASAARIMTDRDPTLSLFGAIDQLLALDLWLHHSTWHHLLWDPFQSRMIAANRVLAETHLLVQLKQSPRNEDAAARYREVLEKKEAGEFGSGGEKPKGNRPKQRKQKRAAK